MDKDQAYYDGVAERLTRIARHYMKAFDYLEERIPDEFVASDQQKGVAPPPLEKAIPEGALTVPLPTPDELDLGRMSLVDVLKKRRSRCAFTEESLSLEELAFLCWSVAGVHRVGPNETWTMRTSPSGGARHPFETYLVVERVSGIDPGIYRYSGLQHRLVLVKPGAGFADRLAEKAVQAFVKSSAVVFIWAAVPYRHEWRYMFTGAKHVAMDMGHYCQNLYLAAESIGAGTCAIAAYRQEVVDKILGVDGEDEFAVYVAPVGKISEE